MRCLLRLILERGGFLVAEARDGQEALELAATVRPGVLVTDLIMPRRSGRDLIVALRARAGFADLPALLLTASPHHPAAQKLRGMPHTQVMQKLPPAGELLATLHGMIAAHAACDSQPLLAS